MFLAFSIIDGITTSLFSISIVFIVLIILSVIISQFKHLSPEVAVEPVITVVDDDQEELLVAKIIASCLFQKDEGQDVVIKSIKRIQ